MLIVISGPSGVGKGTVIKELIKRNPAISLAISYTTRPRRNGERNGAEYHFVDEATFSKTDFLEWAEVHGAKYGTPNIPYEGDVVFEVDMQGAKSIKQKCPACVSIFLVPPSEEELVSRLQKRNTETNKEIKVRLTTAKKEMKSQFDYDYVIVNKALENTIEKVEGVIQMESNKRKGGTSHGK